MDRKLLLSSLLAGQMAIGQQAVPVKPDTAKPTNPQPIGTKSGRNPTVSLRKPTEHPAEITGDIFSAPQEAKSIGPQKFTYGSTLPPVPCSFGRLCEILLETGEFVDKEPILGDAAHWGFEVRLFGTGDRVRTTVIAKLTEIPVAISSTDLIIATNRRDYHLTLAFDPQRFTPSVEFTYPEDEKHAVMVAAVEERKRQEEQAATEKQHAAEVINRDYEAIVSKNTPARMVPRVKDNGTRTKLEFKDELRKWDAPVLLVAGINGCEKADYQQDGAVWTYNGLFEQAELILGEGKHARRVLLRRAGLKGDSPCGTVHGHKVSLKGDS